LASDGLSVGRDFVGGSGSEGGAWATGLEGELDEEEEDEEDDEEEGEEEEELLDVVDVLEPLVPDELPDEWFAGTGLEAA